MGKETSKQGKESQGARWQGRDSFKWQYRWPASKRCHLNKSIKDMRKRRYLNSRQREEPAQRPRNGSWPDVSEDKEEKAE